MNKRNKSSIIILMVIGVIVGGTLSTNIAIAAPQRPSDENLMAFKVYHHAVYMVTTAKQAGGTNKLLHTTELPTEGADPVVTPALDHIYSKAVLDLTSGPVVVEFPEIKKDCYFSIHITDQEHYTIYDEIHSAGKCWRTLLFRGSLLRARCR